MFMKQGSGTLVTAYGPLYVEPVDYSYATLFRTTYWIKMEAHTKPLPADPTKVAVADMAAEIVRLEKELAEVKVSRCSLLYCRHVVQTLLNTYQSFYLTFHVGCPRINGGGPESKAVSCRAGESRPAAERCLAGRKNMRRLINVI